MFNFDYQEPEQMNQGRPELVGGAARFTIIDAVSQDENGNQLMSKSGSPKMNLTYEVTDIRNTTGKVFEVVSARTAWKLKNILDCVNLSHLYSPNGLDENELIGAQGSCMLKLEVSEGYKDRMIVSEYKKPVPDLKTSSQSVQTDDLPF